MKTPTSALICALLSLLVSVAYADCTADRCENVRITRIVTTPDRVWVKTSGTLSNLNCTVDSGVYVALLRTNGAFREIYSNLLAFQIAGLPISIRIDDGSSPCSIAYVYGDTP